MEHSTYIDAEFVVKPLGLDALRRAYDLMCLQTNQTVMEIRHNGCGDFFNGIMDGISSVSDTKPALAELYGMRVIERSDIPKGQIRMVDGKGNLVQVFTL